MKDPAKERYNYDKHIKPLSSVMEAMLKKFGLYNGLMEVKIEEAWPIIAGPAAQKYTAEIKIINNRLYVKVLSSTLRNDLHMNKEQVKGKIKQMFNLRLDDVIFY